MHPLDNIDLRFVWAKEHLDVLLDELQTYGKSDPYSIRIQVEAETGDYVCYGYTVQKPPPKIARVSVDFVNQMRSGLDNLAARLGCDKGFPIFHEDIVEKRVARVWRRRIVGFQPHVIKVLDEVQPYQRARRGEDPKRDPLYLLNRLWNDDKHSDITVTSSVALTSSFGIRGGITLGPAGPGPATFGGGEVRAGPFKDGDEVGRLIWRNIAVQGEPKLDAQFSFAVAYGQIGPAFGVPIGLLCLGMYNYVRDELVPRFVGFFPPRSG